MRVRRPRAAASIAPSRRGSLTVVGAGITLAQQATIETIACIERAEKVFHLLTNPAAEVWVRRLNPQAVPLGDCLTEGKPRSRSYSDMSERIVAAVRSGLQVCAVFYGNAAVLVQPAYEAITRARSEGFSARMVAGVSAEDCLFADLVVNPQGLGWQCFEATDFLLRRRRFDPTAALILWQVGLLGEASVRPEMAGRPERLRVLTAALRRHYSARHRVVLYEAAQLPICEPIIKMIPLARLPQETIFPATTLYIPPKPTVIEDAKIRRWFVQD